MTQIVFSLTLAAIVFWASFDYIYPYFFGDPPEDVTSVSLEKTISELKLELAQIGETPGDTAGLVLDDVKIELTTQRDNENAASGALAVPVFKEASLESKTAIKLTQGSKMTLVFKAPNGTIILSKVDGGDTDPGNLDLSEIVLAARSALLSTLEEEPALIPKSVEIEVSFVFVKTDTTEAGVKAFVVEIGGSSEVVKTGGNKVTLSFLNPAFQKKKGAEGTDGDEAEETPIIPPK